MTLDEQRTRDGGDPRRAALEALSLTELEEAAGELQRRLGVALRRIGERDADRLEASGLSPRRRTAELAVQCEVTALALAALAAGMTPGARLPLGHPALAAAIAYAAPNLVALLMRLDQDRRLLTSLARQLESRLDEPMPASGATPVADGAQTPRRLLVEALIEEPARAALALERAALTREV